jgi:hypothetical protein
VRDGLQVTCGVINLLDKYPSATYGRRYYKSNLKGSLLVKAAFVFVTLCLTLLFLPSVASADEILTYTGHDYTRFYFAESEGFCLGVCNPPYTTSMYETATIDLGEPLPDSSDVVVTPVSFTLNQFNDGGYITNLTLTPYFYSYFEFITGADGAIIGWDVRVYGTGEPGPGWASGTAGDKVFNNYDAWEAFSSVPGTWTESFVPEPSTLPLLAVGLPLAVMMSRKRMTRGD